MPKHNVIKLRRGTAAEWQTANELLQLGEPGYEKDTNKLKIGDGVTLWNDLDYVAGGSSQHINTSSIEITGNTYYAGESITVYQIDSTTPNRVYDNIDTDLVLTRDENGGLYNIALEESYDDNSPTGTEWNADGWDDLSNLTSRSYTSLYYVLNEQIGKEITNAKLVMHDTINNKYYKVDFSWWQPGAGNNYYNYPTGGFRYTRTLLWVEQESVEFIRNGNQANVVDVIDNGLTIKRANNGGGIFNSESESGWDPDISPSGTLWNIEGWDNLTNVSSRDYRSFYSATGGQLGNMVETRQYVMKDTINNKYYKVQFTNWGGGGAFSYTRQQLNGYSQANITFGDGTVQNTAFSTAAVSGVINDTLNTSLVAGNNINLNYDGNSNSLTIFGLPNVIDVIFDTTINTDASSGDIFNITLTDNITLANPTNPTDGQTIRWRIVQDNNGNRSVALGNKFVLPSSATSPLPWSTSPNKMDILAATYHAGRDKWDVVAFVPGY